MHGTKGLLFHFKCRNMKYLNGPMRFEVPDDKVSFDVEFEQYSPVEYTDFKVLGNNGNRPIWADDFQCSGIKFNQIDVEKNLQIDRTSFNGEYKIVDNRPQNPIGRTGITGRGLLGRWGPNHAADPIVTCWERNDNGDIIQDHQGQPTLMFVAIKRKDTDQWAIPGGMVEPGSNVSATLKAEFSEEAMNSLEMNEEEKSILNQSINEFFSNGNLIYQGYVDDPRNTDNAWMETVAINFHDQNGTIAQKFQLKAGDDACQVQWVRIDTNLNLYASHFNIIQKVQNLLLKKI